MGQAFDVSASSLPSNGYGMLCTIRVEPVNLTAAGKFLQVIVSKRSLDQVAPFHMAIEFAKSHF